jgi:hypothetical protein
MVAPLPTATPYRAMNLDLSDEETAALAQELHDIVESDRYPFSPRIRTLRAILEKLRPEPAREPLPPPKVYAPPRSIRGRRRRGAIHNRSGDLGDFGTKPDEAMSVAVNVASPCCPQPVSHYVLEVRYRRH